MAAQRCDAIGLLLAVVLGAGMVAPTPTLAADPPARVAPSAATSPAGAAPESSRDEVVITGRREADAVITAKVKQALTDDPYLLADHVTVSTENGVVRLEGSVYSVAELYQTLRLARRIAGKRQVINNLELRLEDDIGTM